MCYVVLDTQLQQQQQQQMSVGFQRNGQRDVKSFEKSGGVKICFVKKQSLAESKHIFHYLFECEVTSLKCDSRIAMELRCWEKDAIWHTTHTRE